MMVGVGLALTWTMARGAIGGGQAHPHYGCWCVLPRAGVRDAPCFLCVSISPEKIQRVGEQLMSRGLTRLVFAILVSAIALAARAGSAPRYQSPFMRVELAPDQPAFTALTLDSLGKGKLSLNPLRAPAPAKAVFHLRQVNSTFEYRPAGSSDATPPIWTLEFSPRRIHLRSRVAGDAIPPPLVLTFDPYFNHATLLGIINADSSVRLPA